jgi:hypothetical protein
MASLRLGGGLMDVISGGAITAERINNLRDIFDLARNSTGIARVELLGAAAAVSKDITEKLEGHLLTISAGKA